MNKKRRSAEGLAVFTTTIGPCGVAWNERGLVCLQLPHESEEATRATLLTRVTLPKEGGATTPPAAVRSAITRIVRHLAGEKADLDGIDVDLEGMPPFHRKVYEAARRITSGEVRTYGELASDAGSPQGARAVGQAMSQNPLPIVVPCHRVIRAGRKLGGFTSPGGLDTKARLLAIEGASLPKSPRR